MTIIGKMINDDKRTIEYKMIIDNFSQNYDWRQNENCKLNDDFKQNDNFRQNNNCR